MDTKLSVVNCKLFLILSYFIMVTDKRFYTVKLPVIMDTGYVGEQTQSLMMGLTVQNMALLHCCVIPIIIFFIILILYVTNIHVCIVEPLC